MFSSASHSVARSRRRPLRRFVPSPTSSNQGFFLEGRSLAGAILHHPRSLMSPSGEVSQAQTQAGSTAALQLTDVPLHFASNSITPSQPVESANGQYVGSGTSSSPPPGTIDFPVYVFDGPLSTNSEYIISVSAGAGGAEIPEGYPIGDQSTTASSQTLTGTAVDLFQEKTVTTGPPGSLKISDDESLSVATLSNYTPKYQQVEDTIGAAPYALSPTTQVFDIDLAVSGGGIVGSDPNPEPESGSFSIGTRPAGNNDYLDFQFSADGVSVQASMTSASITYSTPSGPKVATASGAGGYNLTVGFITTGQTHNTVQFGSDHILSGPEFGLHTNLSDNVSWAYNVSLIG